MNTIKCILPSSIEAITAYAKAVGPDYTWTMAEADCEEHHPEFVRDFAAHRDLVGQAEAIVKRIMKANMPFPTYSAIDLGGNRKYSLVGITYRWEDPYLICAFDFTQF